MRRNPSIALNGIDPSRARKIKLARASRNPSTKLDGIARHLFFMKLGVKLGRFFIKFVSKPSPKLTVLARSARLSEKYKNGFVQVIIDSRTNPLFTIISLVLRAGIEPARPQGTQDFLTSYGFRRL